MSVPRLFGSVKVWLCAAFLVFAGSLMGQNPPPAPLVDPSFPNIYYGAVNPAVVNFQTPVLLFVPGYGGVAQDWFNGNDMYGWAYTFGYRTAFVAPTPDNTPATGPILQQANVLKGAIKQVALHYGVSKLYLIGHSKGGLDIQAAVVDPTVAPLVKGIFTISTPNTGTELADWAFENPDVAGPLNLLTSGVDSLRLANMAQLRAALDPLYMLNLKKPFYTIAGTQFLTNPLTLVTGAILRDLVPGLAHDTFNDGLVTVARSRLSKEFSNDLGTLATHHFDTDTGSRVFHKIRGRIQGIETSTDEFDRIAVDGLARFGGSSSNAWIWSMKWFKGKLYIGTGREQLCQTLLTADIRTGTSIYPAAVLSGQCPDQKTLAQSLAAEIWQYTPETQTWVRVFQSPATIPVMVEGEQVMTARDVGFRGMTVHKEPDGTEALYVGGVTSGSLYETEPFQPGGFPPPRILRSVDGVTWTALPQEPGTFLGDIGDVEVAPNTKIRSFRTLTSYKGQLFASAGSYVGSGIVVASANPTAGNDAWRRVSPEGNQDLNSVWMVRVYNNYLYVTTGQTRQENPLATGYAVYKTDATGDPYTWIPVVVDAGYQSDEAYKAPNGLSMMEFRGELYVGTNRPTELIRIRPDDTWDLIVGEPRMTPQGLKKPLSGFGNGFGNWMNGHFWQMTAHQNQLYLGTWDWGVGLQGFTLVSALDDLFTHQYGFDLYKSEDGVTWSFVTNTGLGDPNNSGVRSLESTPVGLFLGSARQRNGAEVFLRSHGSTNPVPAPRRLRAESVDVVGNTASLAWDPSPGAVRYNVYRYTAQPLEVIFPGGQVPVTQPNGTVTYVPFNSILSGAVNPCAVSQVGTEASCAATELIGTAADLLPNSYPMAHILVGQTTGTTFTEAAPTRLQSIYFVRAVDAQGRLSDPSNIVGAPSKAALVTLLQCNVDSDNDIDRNDIALILESLGKPKYGDSDPRDANNDGSINIQDSRFCTTKCTKPGCGL